MNCCGDFYGLDGGDYDSTPIDSPTESCSYVSTKSTLAVKVKRRRTGTPISNVEVCIKELGSCKNSDEEGWAIWDPVDPGAYRIDAQKTPYVPAPATTSVSVGPNETKTAELELDCPRSVIVRHLWQEWHRQAAAGGYAGPSTDDGRVVENTIGGGDPTAKQRLHLCFQERALATFESCVIPGEVFYAKWEIIDSAGNVIREHPQMSQARYDANHADAKLRDGLHSWLWDGRNSASNRVFVAVGAYRSRITIKDAGGAEIHTSEASIAVEGTPYRIFIIGRPKIDGDLAHEFARPAYAGRFLDTRGRRIARDCWLLVYRGLQNEGHAVFLGQGTIEAQKTDAGVRAGAIATPHGREFKGWIRRDPHSQDSREDRVQVEDVGRTDQVIALLNPGGPSPANPYSDTAPGTAVKDGVQAHAGRRTWVGYSTSVGCTTASSITGRSVSNPGSIYNNLRSINSKFGSWGDAPSENVAVRGPKFKNKQNKRNNPVDSLIADDHSSPVLDPAEHPAPPEGPPLQDEPLHMQQTMQAAVFGGFEGYEIARTAAVADEPTNLLRVRLSLENYSPDSMYHLYHHAVVFGHSAETVSTGIRITAWFPRKVIRGWNGNFRNILVRGRCEIAWYIDHRPPIPYRALEIPALHPAGGTPGTKAALPNSDIGRSRRTWNSLGPPLPPPGQYFSVIEYRLELRPFTVGNDDWTPEPAATDLLPPNPAAGANRAQLAAERLVTSGGRQYLEGSSTLLLLTV